VPEASRESSSDLFAVRNTDPNIATVKATLVEESEEVLEGGSTVTSEVWIPVAPRKFSSVNLKEKVAMLRRWEGMLMGEWISVMLFR